MADSIAVALARANGAELDRAVRVSVFYLGLAQSEAANSPGSWAKWERLRRDLGVPASVDAPWWVRTGVR